MIENAGASLRFLSPYSPDFNPIEKAFSRLKAMLKKAAERTISASGASSPTSSTSRAPKCARYFVSCGYTDRNPL